MPVEAINLCREERFISKIGIIYNVARHTQSHDIIKVILIDVVAHNTVNVCVGC